MAKATAVLAACWGLVCTAVSSTGAMASEAPVPRLLVNFTKDPPLYGVAGVRKASEVEVYNGNPSNGSYSHGAMIGYHAGQFLLSWKNSPTSEDQPGQRILYSHSIDAVDWAEPAELFPGISAVGCLGPLWGAPHAVLRGNLYASASLMQACLFPIDHTDGRWDGMVFRRVTFSAVNAIPPTLGPIFWVGGSGPDSACIRGAAASRGVVPLSETDAETQADIAALIKVNIHGVLATNPLPLPLPCDLTATTKCEACSGDGCQPLGLLANGTYPTHPECAVVEPWMERTHFDMPGGGDVLLYRSTASPGSVHRLCFSRRTRVTNGPGVWSWPLPTEIPDVDSNINAGSLPDGRIYLLSNPVVASTTRRNPLVISLTDDGTNFDRAMVVASCLAPPYSRPGQPDGCKMRNAGAGKAPGPQYPQGVVARDKNMMAIAFSQNKEDIWVVTVKLDSL